MATTPRVTPYEEEKKREKREMATLDPLQDSHTQQKIKKGERKILWILWTPSRNTVNRKVERKEKRERKTKKHLTAALDPLWQCCNQFDRKIGKKELRERKTAVHA